MLDFDTLKINLGVERVAKVLKELGNPHLDFKSIHVAGTNGKGSVSAMLASVLKEAGIKTGLFTSPHLFKWNERIKIEGDDISDQDLNKNIDLVDITSKRLGLELTQFEIITCAAFKYFSDKKIEYAVVEVGMGGRLDATNVITPIVSVITNIDFDHTEYLGDTLEKIAKEKGGIIKKGIPLFIAEKKEEPKKVLISLCNGQNSDCFVVNPLQSSILKGSYQKQNEGIARAVLKFLSIDEKIIDAGIKKTVWKGRFQAVSQDPLIILDGAHNPSGARALVDSIKEMGVDKSVVFILGFQGYKDVEGIIKILKPSSKKIIFTKSSHPQSADLFKYSPDYGEYIPDINEALSVAKKEGGTIFVAGSLFLVADVMALFKTQA